MERFGPVLPEKRAELMAVLKKNAAALEAQAVVIKTVVKLVGPTVVKIEADTKHSFSLQMGHGRHIEESGSGVIIELGGKYYVLTNRHVIDGAALEGIKITLADGRRVYPEKLWKDPETDVAVLAMTATDVVASPVGDSDAMEIGDFVLALGSPFGLSHSVTLGIISAKGRRDLELGDSVKFQDFLQTDAAINPGNSGGPLVNLRGEVIGINTAIASNSGGNEGIGFSIPINMFVLVARQLIEHGTVVRAFMGVGLVRDFGPGMATELGLPRPVGALVNSITPGSPAQRADLRVGDVILEFNHVFIDGDSHLVNLVSMTEVGKQVPLVIYRNRQTVTLKIEVGDRSKFNTEPAAEAPPGGERK
jgi:serine protease Do